ncbi:hypothetical protein AAVH_21019 [Aphelenchoides avenae]|nr:hypothetical protein AAVH_21019 [Aphelenchus avenae]
MDRLHTIDALGQPRRTDAPTPRNAFVELWLEDQHFKDGFTESSGAEHFVFENAKAAKKLEVFMWTIAEVNEDEAQTGVNNVFLLQVLDM